MSSNAVIQTSGLGKAYRIYQHPSDRLVELLNPGSSRGTDFWALQDVDLSVQPGEAVGVIGRNGSGKSTLLQLICGILQPSAGDIAVRGRVAGLLELGAGFSPDFTGRENVHLAAAILGLRVKEIAARFDAIEAFAGIGKFIERPVREYSSGMYARLAFAVCAHVDADILVVDEILAVGDAAFQQKCMRFLRLFRAGGGTVLFVSHSEDSVLGLCERAVWLDLGRLQTDGPSRDVCRRYATSLQDSGSSFQKGGRAKLAVAAPAVARVAPQSEAPPVERLDFDPDTAVETGDGKIEQLAFFAEDGAQVTLAEGGERLDLRIGCVSTIDIHRPVVAFSLRNRIGRVVFGDDTGLTDPGHTIEAGRLFSACFQFYLPFLPSGEYSIEAFVFETAAKPQRLLARSADSHFLPVHSRHVGGGLANIPVIETTIDVKTQAGADVL